MIARGWVTVLCAVLFAMTAGGANEDRVLLIVIDGFRADYLDQENGPVQMPHLRALARQGVWSHAHHAALPSVTRVNSATFATGAYPSGHGIMDNTVYFPAVDSEKTFSTASASKMQRLQQATQGHLLTAVTLAEWLAEHGESLLVCSSGSGGSAFLQDPAGKGTVINVDTILPETMRARVEAKIGTAPEEATPNIARNHWAIEAYLKVGLEELKPRAAVIWLSDPDHTAHEQGVGSPDCAKALRAIDDDIERINQAHAALGLRVDVMVVGDHGFIDYTPELKGIEGNLAQLLEEDGLKKNASDVVVTGNSIYINDPEKKMLAPVVERLYRESWVGAIFTRPAGKKTSIEGRIPGTLSTALLRVEHERTPDLYVFPQWTDAPGKHGFAGTTPLQGAGSHGGLSPYEAHPFLAAFGPNFKQGVGGSLPPSGNADIAPTLCELLEIPVAPSMQGRVLREFMAGQPAPAAPEIKKQTLGNLEVWTQSYAGQDYLCQARRFVGK